MSKPQGKCTFTVVATHSITPSRAVSQITNGNKM